MLVHCLLRLLLHETHQANFKRNWCCACALQRLVALAASMLPSDNVRPKGMVSTHMEDYKALLKQSQVGFEMIREMRGRSGPV